MAMVDFMMAGGQTVNTVVTEFVSGATGDNIEVNGKMAWLMDMGLKHIVSDD